MTHSRAPLHLVIMGVSGTGKTSLALHLQQKLGWVYAEGDDFHPPENVAKMRGGRPLNDQDRAPWLASIATWMSQQANQGNNTLVTCSALKRKYRDTLRTATGRVLFLHLVGEEAVLTERMLARTDHFMPAGLLRSQLDTLEPLGVDEAGFTVDVAGSKDEVFIEALHRISSLDDS